MPKLTSKQLLIIGGVAAVAVVSIILVLSNLRSTKEAVNYQITVWGTDPIDAMRGPLGAYKGVRPDVEVKYEQIAANGYDGTVLEALAAGTGPDVFLIRSLSLSKEVGKLASAPPEAYDSGRMRDDFPAVVEQDFVADGDIYALPIYLDSLALFYNKDFFDQAGIVAPPATWEEFQNHVALLRNVSESGQIIRAGAAIGGSEKSVAHGTDLLNLLMLQNGTKMLDDRGAAASFANIEQGGRGIQAFDFYLQFANPASPYYTWNDAEVPSLDAFAAGNAAMAFGYYSDLAGIEKKSPFLRVGIAPIPQPSGASGRVDYAKYQGFAVSKQSKSISVAWNFIVFLASDANAQAAYLSKAIRPPATRAFIATNQRHPQLGVYARQALTARSWRQADPEKVNEAFNGAILRVLSGRADAKTALTEAQDRVTATIKKQ